MRETVWLGQIDRIGGPYQWTVIADSKAAAEKALRTEYRKAVKDGAVYDVRGGVDALEYHGARFTEMTIGKVEWL